MPGILRNFMTLSRLASHAGLTVPPLLETRIQADPALDYGIETAVLRAFSRLTEADSAVKEEAEPALKKLTQDVATLRQQKENEELARLHADVMASGTLAEFPMGIGIRFFFDRLQKSLPIVLGALKLESRYWGTLNLARLNELASYGGGLGQVELLRDLSVVIGTHQNLPLVPSFLEKSWKKRLGWKQIATTWRRAWHLIQQVPWDAHKGIEGYLSFAHDFVNGDLLMAHLLGSALLPRTRFVALGWGKQIPLTAGEVDTIRPALREALSKVPSHPSNVVNLEGYTDFARQYTEGNLQKAFQVASALLTREEFQKLRWGNMIPLHVDEVPPIREALLGALVNVPRLPEGEIDLRGYMSFARRYTDGNLPKAHRIASALLSKAQFQKLHWGKKIPLRVPQVEPLLEALREALIVASTIPAGEINLLGYQSFATDFTKGDMALAYRIARSLLAPDEMRRLRWGGELPLTVSQIDTVLQALRVAVAKPTAPGAAVINLESYRTFACDFAGGHMSEAWDIARILLPENEFRRLGWGRVIPLREDQVDSFQRFLEEALTKVTDLPEEVLNLEGYLEFARLYVGGDLDQAYKIGSALLSPAEFKKLRWGRKIPLNVRQIEKVKKALNGTVKGASRLHFGESNLAGYILFAKNYADGDLEKAHRIASVLLSPALFRKLRWGRKIRLRVEKITPVQEALRTALMKASSLPEGSFDLNGIIDFARDHTQGYLKRAHQLAKAFLPGDQFRRLRWGRPISIHLDDFAPIQEDLRLALANTPSLPENRIDLEGYKKFARRWTGGDLERAFSIASSLLVRNDFLKLHWGRSVPLHVEELEPMQRALQEALSDAAETPEGSGNLGGYRRFAERHAGGDLGGAHGLAASLLSPEDFRRLRWGRNIPLRSDQVTSIHRALQKMVEDSPKLPEGTRNLQGYRDFADRHAGGSLKLAHKIGCALLSRTDFLRLKWGEALLLQTDEIEPVTERLLSGIRNEDLVGQGGWQKFADEMKKSRTTVRNIARILLSKHLFSKLGWNLQPGRLAEELIVSRLSRCTDEIIEVLLKRYPNLLHNLITSGDRPIDRNLAVAIIQWTWVESTFIPLPSFERRALQVRSYFTRGRFETGQPEALSFFPRRGEFIEDEGLESPEEAAMRNEMGRSLVRSLESLPIRQQRLMQMVVLDEVPIERAADLLGLSKKEARKELDEALQSLGSQVSPEMTGD